MKSIKELVMKEMKTVYMHTPSKQIAKDFLNQAEKEGFIFADGKKPTRKQPDEFFVLHQNLTINYLGYIGRIAWQCSSSNIIKMEYEEFIRE